MSKQNGKNEYTPILVANEEYPLPENLINDVKQERMISALIDMTHPLDYTEQISWAECVAYLMPATQKKVLRSDVVEIYLYCFRKLMERKGIKVDFETPDKLSDYQMTRLNEFKKWIYEHRGGKEKNPIINALKEVFFEKRLAQQILS